MDKKNIKIYIAGIVYGSMLDGDGLRTVVFLSGCSVGCYSCQNKQYWKMSCGKPFEIEELAEILKKKTPQKKITISGGEPLEQRKALISLLSFLKDFDIGLYTSYELEDIQTEILSYLRFIKVGKFEYEHIIHNQYFGSSNQKIYYVKEQRWKNAT